MFGKDEEGCIHPDEIKFVLSALPSELEEEEIQEMIEIVDRNQDGKISYSEFRVRGGWDLGHWPPWTVLMCSGDARRHSSAHSGDSSPATSTE